MNTPKAGKLARSIILIILVALLTAVIAFAAAGWSSEEPTDKVQNAVNNIVETQPQELTITEEIKEEITLDYLTGLPIEKEEATVIPMAFLFDSNYSSFGLSYAEVNVEFPIENGKTRYLSYIRKSDNLGKIGALSKTRVYINSVAKAFGGTLYYYGSDDVIEKDKENTAVQLCNLYEKNGYSYTENDKEIYSNPYMLKTAVNDYGLRTDYVDTPTLPFFFLSENETKKGTSPAKSLLLPYAADNKTELVYRTSTDSYALIKNGDTVSDPLSYGEITYDNVFVLFADATTYETVDFTQMVLESTKSGTGYYLSKGTYERITFQEDASGNFVFLDTAGKKLYVNPGTTYIGYFKSSLKNSVKIG